MPTSAGAAVEIDDFRGVVYETLSAPVPSPKIYQRYLVPYVGVERLCDDPRGVVGLQDIPDLSPPCDVSPAHPLDVDGVDSVHPGELDDVDAPAGN